MKVALDPYMFRSTPLSDLPGLVADLGYEFIKLCPSEDFMPFYRHPRADRQTIAKLKSALIPVGLAISSVLPLYCWAGPDEEDRRGAVLFWKRAIEIAVDLGCTVMNSEFNGTHDDAGDLHTYLYVADTFDHRASLGNRYILNPPGTTATVHQHLDIGQGEVNFEELFSTLGRLGLDGIMTARVFAWENRARESSSFMLDQIRKFTSTW